MISAAVAAALVPIQRNQAELRERLIGIDGNGTGRIGVLQKQDEKMQAMDVKLDMLVNRSQSWNKKNVWALAKWVAGGICGLALMLLSHWLDHHYGGTP
jgi:hypothetical protein